ncbi:phosphoesterase [Terrabacter tumescens]|uniref:Phosphoesterase n=1 Tax=Terrabacter tumescens TaxID=60443 RepID=A0ABQ2HMW7_9MICO|nr:metallophosphoesterase family protein [Terrabacter tumescens]GGM86586.1 phosphoesterase [Terrabacter tumescens]
MRVLVLSDTHAPRHWKACPPALLPHLDAADVILHAGDVCTPDVLDLLAGHAPVHVVMGNNDVPEVAAWGALETLEIELEGVRIGMVHDSGAKQGRTARLRRRFPTADLVVFGHSHIPLDQTGDGLRILNPGSPTDKRRQPVGTVALLDLRDGEVVEARIEPVPR